MIRRGSLYFLLSITVIILIRCKETPGVLNLPGGLDGNYTLAFVDTTTIRTSTVLVDSLPTSGRGLVLLGKYTDDKMGVIEANPYIQFSLNTIVPSDNAVYDSIGLILHCNGYSYGDVSTSQTIEVRRVTEYMQYHKLPEFWKSIGQYSYFNLVGNSLGEVGQISNIDTVAYDETTVLGSATAKLKSTTLSTDTIYIPLSDVLGQDFFLKMKQRPREFRLNESVYGIPSDYDYANYFRGIRLHTLNESSIVGIKLTDGSPKIRIYYSQIVNGETKHFHYDFPVNTARANYTNIAADRSSSSVASLTYKNKEVSSKITNEETYLQSGVGVVTKITLPHLDAIGNIPGFTQISSAVLILEPVKNSYTDYQYLPNQLTLNYTDKENHVVSPLTVASLSSSRQYSFAITSLVQSIAVAGALPKELSFIVSTSGNTSTNNDFFTTTTRLCIGSGSSSSYRARVEIYYLKEKM